MGMLVSCFATSLCECACCMGLSCFSGIFNASLARATRFGHLCVVVATFIIAIVIGQSYPQDINGYNYYTKVDLLGGCSSEFEDSCIYRQLIYRAGFSLFLLFTFLALTSAVSDYMNRSFWIMKFGFAIGLFIALWWIQNDIFSGWAEFARIVSFFWLLVQGLLLLDFCHDVHDILMAPPAEGEEESSVPYIVYMGLSAGGLGAAIIGLVFLFKDYAGCDLGMFFIILTLIMGVLTTAISLLDSVGKGLLTPCLMFAYSVFMCWYALLSSPEHSCNPTADKVNGAQDGGVIVIGAITLTVLLYCVGNGTTILNIFNPEGEGVMMSYQHDSAKRTELHEVVTGGPGNKSAAVEEGEGGDKEVAKEEVKSSGTAPERVLYHVIMMLVCCYGSMILTNWGKTNGATAEGSGTSAATSSESMWLKIVSQWIFLILYLRVLQVAYNNNTP